MSSDPKAAGAPTPALVFESLFAYQRTAALRAAIEVDLFRAVGEGAADAATIARRCSISERGSRILCDYLTILGLLKKTDGRYSHSETSALFLDPRSPACVASMARFMANPMLQEPFNHLAEIVRDGRTVLPGQGSVEPDNPAWVEFAHSMAPMMAPMAGPLASIVLGGKNGPRVGAGHRRRSRPLRHRDCEAESAGQGRRRRLGGGARGGARQRPQKAGVADRFADAPRQRLRGRFRRAARHRAADQLPASLRSADLHRALEEGARLAQAGRPRRRAGVRAQRGPRFAARWPPSSA